MRKIPFSNQASSFTRKVSLLGVLIVTLSLSECALFTRQDKLGVIKFHDSVPSECNVAKGIRQSNIRSARNEQDLRQHYGITMKISFNDGVTPIVYGTLYYQDEDENRYCVATADGRFAEFADKQITETKRNVIQEVCYPIQECD